MKNRNIEGNTRKNKIEIQNIFKYIDGCINLHNYIESKWLHTQTFQFYATSYYQFINEKKYFCRQAYHEKESLTACCFNTDCTEPTFMLCAACFTQKHLLHQNNIYTFNQIRKLLKKSENEINHVLNLYESLDAKMELLEQKPEIKKLIIMIQKIELEDKIFTGLKEYINKILFQEGQFEKIHQFWKSLGDYKVVTCEEQPKIYDVLNENTDVYFAAKRDELLHTGLQYYEKECYSFALKCFDQLLKIDPLNSSALLYKGFSLTNLQYYQKAIESYEEVLKTDPEILIARQKKGFCLLLQRQIDEAMSYYDKLNELQNKWEKHNQSQDEYSFTFQMPQKKDYSEFMLFLEKSLISHKQGNFPGFYILRASNQYLFQNADFYMQYKQNGVKSSGIQQLILILAYQSKLLENQIQSNKNQIYNFNFFRNQRNQFYKNLVDEFQKEKESNVPDFSPFLESLKEIIQDDVQALYDCFDLLQCLIYLTAEKDQRKGHSLLQIERIDEAIQCFESASQIKIRNQNYFRAKRNALVSAFWNLGGFIKFKSFNSYLLFNQHTNDKFFSSEDIQQTTFVIHERQILKAPDKDHSFAYSRVVNDSAEVLVAP